LIEGEYEGRDLPGDDFAGRYFSCWTAPELASVFAVTGFVDVRLERIERPHHRNHDLLATARR